MSRSITLALAVLGAVSACPAADAPSGRNLNYNAVGAAALAPEAERRTFALPDGFEIELVAAESPGLGKFVALAWDARMRLWTTTALEYPVDGNEQKSASDALFAAGGHDRVVVFDNIYQADVGAAAKPRVFADGLVMPLGVQPWRDGALVQYGADIRLYRDTDGDGRADAHEVVLTGFGTQDSHLFPHQFLRQPGGAMFVAQGLFNYSTVRRPGGAAFADGTAEVAFNQCKLAMMALDGSRFESVTAGPNNIWGLVTSRDGETFLQEANDLGYPVIPYAPGIWVATGSRDRLRPYQPLMPPPLAPAQMGGTGLSGLALAEDRDRLFRRFGAPADEAGTRVFFLANPITNRINAVRATPEGTRCRYEKLPDFLTTTDQWFRPVAIAFGPDGALYIVDWYNKIISHNEVPRAHPDRDKTRGRIWRIRHRDQPRITPPDLTRLDDRALLARLGDANALVARLAWLEIGDRRAAALAPALAEIAIDKSAAIDRRLGALWALEMVQPIATDTLRALVGDAAPPLRREAVRIGCAQPRPEAELAGLLAPLAAEESFAVRCALAEGLRRAARPGATALAGLVALARAPLSPGDGSEWERFERAHERYLARWAWETHATDTHALLASGALRLAETEALAAQAIGGAEGARRLVALRAKLGRELDAEELRTLAANFSEPAARAALTAELASPRARATALRLLWESRAALDPAPLREPLAAATRALLAGPVAPEQTLAADAAGAFKLAAAAPDLIALVRARWREPRQPPVLAALRALRELGAGPVDLLEAIVRGPAEATVRAEALAALTSARDPAAPARLVALLPSLAVPARGAVLRDLAGTPAGAAALAEGLRAGTVATADIGLTTADRLHAVRPADELVTALWQKLGGDALDATPAALTPAEAAAENEKFARFRALANARGNPDRGRELFTNLCLACHAFGGKGGAIGPPLDGVANTGVDTMLRNILTPSAAMEPGYRTFRVALRGGEVVDAFLVEQSADAVVVRLPGANDRRIPRGEIRSAGFTRRSLMPEGLLESLPPEQVSDLFAHLKSLR